MLIKEIKKTPEDFLNYLRLSQDHWDLSTTNLLKKNKWIFRGNANADWKLIPSGWRKNNLLDVLTRKKIKNKGYLNYEDVHREIEIEVLKKFRHDLHDFGYPIDWLYKDVDSSYEEKFRNLLDIACIAQHHGIPTRLLDWTINPITAAYFACEPKNRCKKAKNVCVWALNTNASIFNDGLLPIKIHEQPRNRNDYLRAQQALFTECLNGVNFYKKYKKWPDIEELIRLYAHTSKNSNETVLIKILLDKSGVDKVISMLKKEGVSRSTIMPSLDNLAMDAMDDLIMYNF